MAFTLPPHRKQALRAFALQILNTTLAVLIALSFEDLVDRYRIRKLVATAEAHLKSEIADNKQDVLKARQWAGENRPEVEGCLKMLAAMIDLGKDNQAPPRQSSCGVVLRSTVLSTTSRSTAETTGALGHMSYDQAKRYAGAYEYQETLSHTFERLADHFPMVLRYFRVNYKDLSLEELRLARNDFLTFALLMDTAAGQSDTLLQFYDRALAPR
jgi:hypothetical protein